MKEIRPGIFMITQKGFLSPLKPTVHIYVIAGPNGLVFDAGYGGRTSICRFTNEFNKIKELYGERGLPFSVTRILPSHTHVDHFSGLYGIHKALRLEILLTQSMAENISSEQKYRQAYEYRREYERHVSESPLARRFSRLIYPLVIIYYKCLYGIRFIRDSYTLIHDEQNIDINGRQWMIIPTPGHCRDHISLYDPDGGFLFGGDNILRSMTTWLGPPGSDVRSYISSLERISGLPGLAAILPAHGKPVENPRHRIRELIAWRELRTDHVLEAVRQHDGVSVKEIVRLLYREDTFMKRWLAFGWVVLTLMHLEERGDIERRRCGSTVRYFIR